MSAETSGEAAVNARRASQARIERRLFKLRCEEAEDSFRRSTRLSRCARLAAQADQWIDKERTAS